MRRHLYEASLLTLICAVSAAACGKKKSSSTDSAGGSTVSPTGASVATNNAPTVAGVSAQADPASIGVGGVLALAAGLELDASTADMVLAFPLNGNAAGNDLAKVRKAAINPDGTFGIQLPKKDTQLTAIQACIDSTTGVVDRVKLKAIVGDIPTSITDAQIKQFVQQTQDQETKSGGQSWVLVSMASHPELTGEAQLVAQAESFKFIQLPIGKEGLLAFPASLAKGDVGLGKITASGDDATASLAVDATVFDTDAKALHELARTQKALKFIRNVWMNTNAVTGEIFKAQPYFSWAGNALKTKNGYSAPADAAYAGYGLYFNDQAQGDAGVPTLDFHTLCNTTAANLVMTPPSPLVPTDMNGKALTAITTLDDANMGAPVAENGGSARSSCGQAGGNTGVGLYAYSQGNTTGFNWGGNGFTGKVAEGVWKLNYKSANVANFDLASARALDKDGNPLVYVPAVNVTVDATGLITNVQVKFSRYDTDTGAYVEVSDLTTFSKLVNNSGVSVSLGAYSQSGQTEERALTNTGDGGSGVKPLTLTGNVYSIATSLFTNKWIFPDTAATTGTLSTSSITVDYQMYGNTYRFDYRLHYGSF